MSNAGIKKGQMMPFRKILALLSVILSTACLALGFTIVSQWGVLMAVLIPLLVWLPACKWPSTWLPTFALVVTICLAVAGLYVGSQPFSMVLAATLALSSWDLVLFDHDLPGWLSSEPIVLLEKKHYQSLGLALGLGLVGAAAIRMIRFQIPFCGLVLLVILAFFSLDRIWRTLRARL
jgi:hypothetical protein